MSRDVLHVATYSMRPSWVSHERFLTPEEAMVLVEAVAHDPLLYRRIYDLYGERAWNLLCVGYPQDDPQDNLQASL